MTMEIKGFRGPVLEPGDDGYDGARTLWNGAIDRRPAAIARCTGTADVLAAVRHGREAGLLVSIRGGGHNVGGLALADGALTIDCSALKAVHVDPSARTVRAQPGVLLGDLDHETSSYGLTVPTGIATTTGLAGLTLGGGIGWQMRKHGLTIDNLLSVDVVTADGKILRASADQSPDLYWGLCGGGGNFGVVTSFEFRAHPTPPEILGGPIVWHLEDAADVLRFYRDFIETVPDELTTILALRRALPLPVIPEHLHWKPVLMIDTCWVGDHAKGEEVLRPLRAFGTPALDLVGPKPWIAFQAHLDPGVRPGWHYYWKSADLTPLDDSAIDVLVSNAEKATARLSYTILFQLGGAISRVPEDATAYGHRSAAHNVNINAVWEDPADPAAEEHSGWARRLFSELEPWQDGVYVNFLGDEG
jgi:hypothetical protein